MQPCCVWPDSGGRLNRRSVFMEYIGIFIDGGYLQKIAFQMAPKIRIDIERLVQWIACDLAVRRAFYYDCLPHLGYS